MWFRVLCQTMTLIFHSRNWDIVRNLNELCTLVSVSINVSPFLNELICYLIMRDYKCLVDKKVAHVHYLCNHKTIKHDSPLCRSKHFVHESLKRVILTWTVTAAQRKHFFFSWNHSLSKVLFSSVSVCVCERRITKKILFILNTWM